MRSRKTASLEGRRVIITGAARGIGSALAKRLHSRGARVAVAGLEPELLEDVSRSCGNAHWALCDVGDRNQVEAAVASAAERFGGLDVVVANAGIAGQMPMLGGNPEVMEKTIRVNVLGVYNTLRAAGPYLSHENGYALVMSSLAAAVHLPMMGAYSASKAAVEALANTLRIEARSSGAKVGVAYFAELDTDMTRRGFGTAAASEFPAVKVFVRVKPLEHGIEALERGIARRSRRIVVPRYAWGLVAARNAIQPLVERITQRKLQKVLQVAREEDAPLTTSQPEPPR
jgi:NAD(P)-dependent dehydrogenase (short-subunit alcohol dehydrogenase family)